MTHFDRCAPGHALLTPGQMQAKEYIIWIVCLFVCVYSIEYVCGCIPLHMHVGIHCVHVPLGQGGGQIGEGGLRVKESGSHSKTQHNITTSHTGPTGWFTPL